MASENFARYPAACCGELHSPNAAPAPHLEKETCLLHEACTPQPGVARIETVRINSRLENHAGWPLLCNVLCAMRRRLSNATTRVKEVREFPIGVIGRG